MPSELVVSILANFKDNASPGIDSVGSKLESVQRKGRGAGEVMGFIAKGALGAAGALAAAGGAVTGIVTNFAQTADDISKLSDRTGISAENLSVLKFAANDSAVAMGELEGGLYKLNAVLGDAQAGNKPAIEAFQSLGISVDEIAGRDPAQVFGIVADSIAGIKDPALQTAAAADIFGRGVGPKLLPLLQAGSKGLEDWKEQATELGAVISQDTADAGAQFVSDMDKMKAAMGSIGNELGGALLPVFNELITDAIPLAREVIKSLAPVLQLAGKFFGQIIKAALRLARVALPPLTRVFNAFMPAIQLGINLFGGFIDTLVRLADEILRFVMPVLDPFLSVIESVYTGLSRLLGFAPDTSGFAAITDASNEMAEGVAADSKRAADSLAGIKYDETIDIDVSLNIPDSEKAAIEAAAPSIDAKVGSIGTYVVQADDTLSGLAEQYKVTVEDLMKWNDIDNPNFIRIGQNLFVRDPEAVAAADEKAAQAVARADRIADIEAAANIYGQGIGQPPEFLSRFDFEEVRREREREKKIYDYEVERIRNDPSYRVKPRPNETDSQYNQRYNRMVSEAFGLLYLNPQTPPEVDETPSERELARERGGVALDELGLNPLQLLQYHLNSGWLAEGIKNIFSGGEHSGQDQADFIAARGEFQTRLADLFNQVAEGDKLRVEAGLDPLLTSTEQVETLILDLRKQMIAEGTATRHILGLGIKVNNPEAIGAATPAPVNVTVTVTNNGTTLEEITPGLVTAVQNGLNAGRVTVPGSAIVGPEWDRARLAGGSGGSVN